MLLILIGWLITAWISFTAGHFASWLLARAFKIALLRNFPLIVLLGFAFLAVMTQWVSLFYPINDVVFDITVLLSLLWCVFQRKDYSRLFNAYYIEVRAMPKAIPWLFAAGLLTGLIYCAAPTKCYDEGLYYIQTIKWFSTFKVVPGLGNLDARLGMNSSWHLLATLFNIRLASGYFPDDINGLLFIVIVLYGFCGVESLRNGSYSISYALQASLLLPNFLYYFSIMGPAPDLVVTYFIWVCIILFLRIFEEGKGWNFALLLIFSFFLLTVKLSAFLVFILFGYVILNSRNIKEWLLAIISFLLIVLPWVERNIIMTGYAFYPLPVLDVLHYDWKMSIQAVKSVTCAAEGWAKMPRVPCDIVKSLPFNRWFPEWFVSKRFYDKLIFFMLLLSQIAIIFYAFFHGVMKKRTAFFKENRTIVVLFMTVLLGAMVWFFKAPDFRFGYSWVLCFVFLTTIILFKNYFLRLSPSKVSRIFFVGTGTSFFCMLVMLLVLEKDGSFIVKNACIPSPLPLAKPILQKCNDVYYFRCTDQGWDSPLPCVEGGVPATLHFRREHFMQSGFSVQPMAQ